VSDTMLPPLKIQKLDSSNPSLGGKYDENKEKFENEMGK